MKTIINNIKNRLTKTLEAVRYHYINYKVDIHHFGIEVINLSERVHDLEKKPKIDDLESKLDDLESNLGDLEYKLDDVEYKTDDIIVESDIEEMITEKCEHYRGKDISDLKKMVINLDKDICDLKRSMEASASNENPAQRLTNNILTYFGGDWNVEDFDKCYEIVNKYDIKNRTANKKGGK